MEWFRQGLNLICNRRVAAVMFLSFSSSLPLVLTGSTLQMWYTDAGMRLMAIGALTLIGLPYVIKFLWAPLMDRYVPVGSFGRRRSWIFLTQILLVIGLVIMANLTPAAHPYALPIIAWCVAFASASQDIAIDAYRVDILRDDERGFGAAVTSFAGRMAMLVAGAGVIILAAEIGWHLAYLIMAALMVVEIGVTLSVPRPEKHVRAPSTLKLAVIQPFKEFLSRPYAILILIFIVIYKLTDALALALNSAFLMRGVGFSLIEIGSIYKIVSLVASLVGGFVGGIFYSKLGLFRSLLYFGFLQAASNLAFMVLAIIGKNYVFMVLAVFTDYFCGGLATVAFIAYLMSLCDSRYTATQYAIFSAFMAIGRVFVGPLAAVMVNEMGWAWFYFATFFIGLPALWLLLWMRERVDFQWSTSVPDS